MKETIKKISASLLAAIMVFTYMPVLGLGAVYANDTDNQARAAVLTEITVHFESFEVDYDGTIPELSDQDELQSVKVVGGALDGLTLYLGTDYTVAAKAKKPTTHGVVEFTGINDYEDVKITADGYFTIKQPEVVAEGYEVAVPKTFEYNGFALSSDRVAAATKIVMNGNTVIKKFGTEVTPVDPAAAAGNAGEKYTVKYTDKDKEIYSTEVEIVKKDITDSTIVAEFEPVTYNGTPLQTTVKNNTVVTADGVTLDEYALKFDGETNINAGGEAVAYFDADAGESKNFTGTGTTCFTISAYEYTEATRPEVVNVTIDPKSFTYNGEDQKPTVTDSTVYFHNVEGEVKYAIPTTDYDIVVGTEESINAGEYGVWFVPKNKNVVGDSFYLNGENAHYTINKYDFAGSDVEVSLLPGVTEVPAGIELDTVVDETVPEAEREYYFERFYQVTFKGKTLEYGKDYTVHYKDEENALLNKDHDRVGDTYVVVVEAKGDSTNFTGKKEISYKAVLNKFDAEVYASAYAGAQFNIANPTTAHEPTAAQLGAVTAKTDDNKLIETIPAGKYKVVAGTYKNNVNAGDHTATVEIQGLEEYENETATVTFTINPYDLSSMFTGNVTTWEQQGWNWQQVTTPYPYITGLSDGKYFKGKVITGATVHIRIGSAQNGTNYELSGDDVVVQADGFTTTGTTTRLTRVKVTPKGNYKYKNGNDDYFTITLTTNGSGSNNNYNKAVTVTNYDIHDEATVTGLEIPAGMTADWYHNQNITDYVEVKIGDEVVDKNDYTPVFVNQVYDNDPTAWTSLKPGDEIEVRVDAKANTGLTGESNLAAIKVVARDIAAEDATVDLAYATVEYNGTAHEPAVTVTLPNDAKYNSGALANENDFEVKYDKNVNAGEATVTVTGKGNYTGTVTKTFTIEPKLVTQGMLKPTLPEKADRVFAVGAAKDLGDKFGFKVVDGTFEETLDSDDYTITKVIEDQVITKDWTINTPIEYSVELKGNFTSAPLSASYTLEPKDVTNGMAVVTFDSGNNCVKYVGNSLDKYTVPAITVTVDGAEVAPADYDTALLWNSTVEVGSTPTIEIVFEGNNYRGRDISNKIEVVANSVDLSEVKLVKPTVTDYSTLKPVTVVKANYIGDNAPSYLDDALDVEVTLDGKAYTGWTLNKGRFPDRSANIVFAPKSPVGHYTVKTKPATGYALEEGSTCDELEFDIVPQKVNEEEFDKMVDTLSASDVQYAWDGVENPTLSGLFADEFEVVRITEFEGKAAGEDAMTGTATVALKEDANYVFAGTGEVTFDWIQGSLYDIEDWNEIYYINNQFFYNRAAEPTEADVVSNYPDEFPTSWVKVTGWRDNTSITSAAFADIEVTSDDNKYEEDTVAGSIKFRIVTATEVTTEANEAVEAAAKVDDTYSADSAKAVADAKAALEAAMKYGTTTEIIAATKALNDAIAEADADKKAAQDAKAEAITASAGYTVDAGYDADSVKAVNDAVAALQAATKYDDVVNGTAALNKAMADADLKVAQNNAKATLDTAATYTDKNYTYASVVTINEAVAALEKALKGGDTAEIKSATEVLNSAIKVAVPKNVPKITISPKKKYVKASYLKKKARTYTLKATVSSGATAKFKKIKGSKRIKVSKTGKVTVRKYTKKGTYKVTVRISVPKTETAKARTVKRVFRVVVQ